jgi:long-chain acyl-CoA synthetase
VVSGRGAVFLTGATGFLGGEILARYLERSDRRVFVLVRAGDEVAAEERLEETLAQVTLGRGYDRDRVVAVPGDITAPDLGLDRRRADGIAEEVGEVIHSAASVSFTLSLAESREINVAGTERVLSFAERCLQRGGLRRFAYVSTAYVAGEHRGCFGEDDLSRGQGFRNPYERSKHEAESLVRSRDDRLPVQVFRPSIIVGDSRTGWTSSFNVLYWPLRAFARGGYSLVPARTKSPVDVVPVDYVADAIYALCDGHGTAGETYNLVAGERAATVGEIIGLAARYFEREPPRMVTPELYTALRPVLLRTGTPRRRRTLRNSEAYFPYFGIRSTFDDRTARSRLSIAGLECPPLNDYFERLLDFATAARWGRRRVARPRPVAALRALAN